MHENPSGILVLGVGNILFTDEGVGVRVVEKLMQDFEFPEDIILMDGGTLGTKLMDYIMACEKLIVVDAVLGGDVPGSVYRLTGEDLRKSLAFTNSMHQTDLVDTLIFCELAGHRPEAVVIGIEPHDYKTLALELSEPVLSRIDTMTEIVLREIEQAGGSYSPKQ